MFGGVLQKHDKGTTRGRGNYPDNNKPEFKKLYGMQAAIRKGTFTFNGWPLGHVVSCLWGSKGKLISILGHHEMCGIPDQNTGNICPRVGNASPFLHARDMR